MSRPYLVTWKIDIDADNHTEAAAQALIAMRDQESTATVFEVQKHLPMGKLGHTLRIDLEKQPATLTRAEAIALIDDQMSDLGGEDTGYEGLLALAKHWEPVGFDVDEEQDPETMAQALREFVDGAASQDRRDQPVKDSDSTCLTAPPEDHADLFPVAGEDYSTPEEA